MDTKQRFDKIVNLIQYTPQEDKIALLYKIRKLVSENIEELESSNNDVVISDIQSFLRERLPVTAVAETENIRTPDDFHEEVKTTIHLDSFLYDDDVVDDMCDEGTMSRNYCLKCGSRETKALDMISHSLSVNESKYIFRYLLPSLDGKSILDVGSRLGTVLYMAYYYSDVSHIYGVEMNSELCELQKTVVEKYDMQDKIQVICSDICNQNEIVCKADVIVLHNVFEFFLDVPTQQKCWQFLVNNICRPGVLLVTSPSLQESFTKAQVSFDLDQWVKLLPLDDLHEQVAETRLGDEGDVNFEAIHLYEVVGKVVI